MARRRRRRSTEPEQPQPRRTSIARLDYPDQDTLRLRTFWSPAPTWVYGAVPGIIGAVIAVLVLPDADSILTPILLGAAIGYFGGGILWALLGAVGGDALVIEFDLKDDRGRVHQSMLWLYQRNWQFELEEVDQLRIRVRRARPLLLMFTGSFTNVLELEGGRTLSVGRFPTENEAVSVADELSDFLGCPLDRSELER